MGPYLNLVLYVLLLNNFSYLEIKCVIRTPLDPAEGGVRVKDLHLGFQKRPYFLKSMQMVTLDEPLKVNSGLESRLGVETDVRLALSLFFNGSPRVTIYLDFRK